MSAEMDIDYNWKPDRTAQPVVDTPKPDAKDGMRALALGQEAPVAERARNADGTFTKAMPSTEDADAAWIAKAEAGLKESATHDMQAPEATPEATAPEQAEGSETESVDKEALAAAMLDAQRLQIPAKALEGMSKAEIVQAGRSWAKQVSENGKLSQKFGELEKQIEAIRAGKEAASAKADQPASDLDSLVQPFVADFDESTRKSLSGIAKAIHSQAEIQVNALKGEFAKMKAELESLQQASGRVAGETIRGELKGRFPQLGKADAWNAVLSRADALVKLPEYQGNPKLAIEHAARIECASSQPAEQVSESTRDKRNGVASTSSQAPRKAPIDSDRLAYFGKG